MTIDALRDKIRKLSTNTNSVDGIILTIGVGALILGILVDVFVIRLLCLLLVAGVGALVYAAIRGKQFEISPQTGSGNSPVRSQSEKAEMKKLVFDDFQSHHGPAHIPDEEVHNNESDGHLQQTLQDSPAMVRRTAPAQVFVNLKHESVSHDRVFKVSDFFDVDSSIYDGDNEPRTEFDFLLTKVLGLIKEVLFAHSVSFFWANRDKHQMVMETRVTESTSFIASRRFSMGHDLLSKVAEHGVPELITEVNPLSEQELIPYYETPNAIKSFIGVPVFFSKKSDPHSMEKPVAVIAIDSKVEDQFGQETLVMLGQYTKLVSALIKIYNDKYDLLLDAELLKSIRRLQEKIRNNFSMQTIMQSLADETSKLINWDFLSIVLYDEHKHAWVAKKVMNRGYHEEYLGTDQPIEFPTSIVGQTIKRNTHHLVDDLEHHSGPRYFAAEPLTSSGAFISVPISSLNKCYGALNLESREKFNFSRRDIEMLYRLTENVASALEILYMQEIINEYVIIDDVTGVYSKKFFLQRMEEEMRRADESGSELSMLFITIDKASEVANRFGQDGFERVMFTLAKAIRASVRPYEVVGRYDHHQFGIILIDTPANDAYLWAEKIRKNVAAHIISLEGKSFSITISTGVCGVLDGMKKEELVGNTITVLNKASEAGGNAVRVY
jgi:diguanylate cyclase (GGDEF)-like protein